MEFYSERCADWLDNNPNIHPDKLSMEVKRFQSMLANAELQNNPDQIDDLQLTVQLLSERLNGEALTQSAANTVTSPSATAHDTDQQAALWDASSLTHHGEQAPEILDDATKEKRKDQLLMVPGIQLGTSSLKHREKK